MLEGARLVGGPRAVVVSTMPPVLSAMTNVRKSGVTAAVRPGRPRRNGARCARARAAPSRRARRSGKVALPPGAPAVTAGVIFLCPHGRASGFAGRLLHCGAFAYSDFSRGVSASTPWRKAKNRVLTRFQNRSRMPFCGTRPGGPSEDDILKWVSKCTYGCRE